MGRYKDDGEILCVSKLKAACGDQPPALGIAICEISSRFRSLVKDQCLPDLTFLRDLLLRENTPTHALGCVLVAIPSVRLNARALSIPYHRRSAVL